MKSGTYIVTETQDGTINIIDQLEIDKYALKSDTSLDNSSKQRSRRDNLILEPRYNPHELVRLLDYYTYHASCVEAVAVDSAGINYTLNPVEGVEPDNNEKEVINELFEGINNKLKKMVYDRRSIGYGAQEVIRDEYYDIMQVEHIPSYTLRRHSDMERIVHTGSDGTRVWYMLYGTEHYEDGVLCDLDCRDGTWKPRGQLSIEDRANELLWTVEYAAGTEYYGRPRIISCLGSIKGDLGSVKYNNTFFDNYGMPKFAVTVTGDFEDYDVDPDDPDYDITQTLRYKIGEQIKEVIKNPHSAIVVTIPTVNPESNVKLNIIPLSVKTEEAHFRMYRKDVRDETINAHQVDPSRLGIYDAGSLNGTNADSTMNSYQYGTIQPITSELEYMMNCLLHDLEIKTWRFSIVTSKPKNYKEDLELADFLFERGAMTIRELIENFGTKFGLGVDEEMENDYYLNARYIKGVPLNKIWEQVEDNPFLEAMSVLKDE